MEDKYKITDTTPFADAWSNEIYPLIHDDVQRLTNSTPLREAERIVKRAEKRDKKDKKEKKKRKEGEDEEEEKADEADEPLLVRIVKEVMAKKEYRNKYVNLAWTGPLDNLEMDAGITYGRVSALATDLFCSTAGAAAVSHQTGIDPDEDEGEQTESQDIPKNTKPAPTVTEIVATQAKEGQRPWAIPNLVEKGLEIPIAINDGHSTPELGSFPRLGMCPVVNAVWLAYYWAAKEGNVEARCKLEKLILDWPMDFIFIEGATPEELQDARSACWRESFFYFAGGRHQANPHLCTLPPTSQR